MERSGVDAGRDQALYRPRRRLRVRGSANIEGKPAIAVLTVADVTDGAVARRSGAAGAGQCLERRPRIVDVTGPAPRWRS